MDLLRDKIYLAKIYIKRRLFKGEKIELEEQIAGNRMMMRRAKDLEDKKTKGISKFIKDNLQKESDVVQLEGKSLNYFLADNQIRKGIYRVVTHKRFDSFINLVILLSIV